VGLKKFVKLLSRKHFCVDFVMYFWYHVSMYNWSTDLRTLKKDKEKYAIWKIEQLVNFGLAGEKIDEITLRKYFSQINIDPARRKFLHLLLYGR